MIICAFVPAPEFRCNKPKDEHTDGQMDTWADEQTDGHLQW